MITTILFDYGGVISKSRSKCIARDVHARFGIDRDEFFKIFKKYNSDYEKGLIVNVDYLRTIIREAGLSCKLHELAEVIYSCDILDHKMISLIKKLKRKPLKLALLSNSNPILTEKIRHNKLFHGFEGFFFSDYMGTRKPDLQIFRTAARTLKVQPENCLFVDDREDNIIAAKKAGISTILFESPHDLHDKLQRLKIL